jgi:hypothetical protein
LKRDTRVTSAKIIERQSNLALAISEQEGIYGLRLEMNVESWAGILEIGRETEHLTRAISGKMRRR